MQNCPHCSTRMEDYASVCPGCEAERETIPVPGEPSALLNLLNILPKFSLFQF